MKYISTRGEAQAVGFLDAVLVGLAPDGGLFVPQQWPTLSGDEIAGFAGRPYAEVAADILGRFAGDTITPEVMAELCADAYATFNHAAVTPLKQLYPDLWLLELFHGPTLAFKDVAMQLLGRLYDHVLSRKGRQITIVCATSGDTGGAAVEAFRGSPYVKVVVLFPEGRISDVQRRFMTTTGQDNIRTVAVDGDFDDCQTILKALFQDAAFSAAVDLSGVNSINWARIAAQSVYYFTSAAALGAPGRSMRYCVPTGNFGDAFAGFAAMKMGLPIEEIIVATNSNDILARALGSGRYARGDVAATISPAMDIQIASNFERLYFEAVERESTETARAFRAFAGSGGIDIPPAALASMRERFTGATVSEAETARTILATLKDTGEIIDPHTAVAVAAARRAGKSASPLIALSTAHPAKFPEAIMASARVAPVSPPIVAEQAGRAERIDRLAADVGAVKAYVRAFVGA